MTNRNRQIHVLVETLMLAGTSFTAYDVYKLLKSSNPQIHYGEVKDDIHNISISLLTTYDYGRVLGDWMQNLKPAPWIYHSVTTDPVGYNPDVIQAGITLNTPTPNVKLDDGTATGSAATVAAASLKDTYSFADDDEETVPPPSDGRGVGGGAATAPAKQRAPEAVLIEKLCAEVGAAIGKILGRLAE